MSTVRLTDPDGNSTTLTANQIDALIAAVKPSSTLPAYGWIARGRHTPGCPNLTESGLRRLQWLRLGGFQVDPGPWSYVSGLWLNERGTTLAHQLKRSQEAGQ